jgi:hypothetical protein
LDALQAIRSFQTATGDPLASCLVSIFPQHLQGAPDQLTAVLNQFAPGGVVDFFQRIERCDKRYRRAGDSKTISPFIGLCRSQ